MDEYTGGRARRKILGEVWEEVCRRSASNSLDSLLYQPPLRSPSPPPSEPEGEGQEQAPAELLTQVTEKTVRRVAEETRFRQMLVDSNWVAKCPVPDVEDARKLRAGAAVFLRTFIAEHCREFDPEHVCRDLRLLTCEAIWTLDALAAMRAIPRCLFSPHDKAIRMDAGSACSEYFCDPGNFCWDLLFNVLRLWRYVGEPWVGRIERVQASEYGSSGSNVSSRGSINLRGNVLESLLCQLQRQAL